MKRLFSILAVSLVFIMTQGCSVSRHSTYQKMSSLDKYQYFFIPLSGTVTGGSGTVIGINGGVYGSSSKSSVNPSDIISGYLMKRGMVRLPEMKDSLADKTLIINYGESGRHSEFMGFSTEITLQFLDGLTNEIVATSTAAGMGSAVTDDIRKAVLLALDNVFKR